MAWIQPHLIPEEFADPAFDDSDQGRLYEFQQSAINDLCVTDQQAIRLIEAYFLGAVDLNNTTTRAEIIEFFVYRRKLRMCVQADLVGELPAAPPFITGT